jgi:hypothetical protein
MLKFEIRNIIVDEEILDEVHLKLVNNIGVDTVKMREIVLADEPSITVKRRFFSRVFNQQSSFFLIEYDI